MDCQHNLCYNQRMYKFKFDPPQQHRRSLQTHKNQHVPLINTLEKCTQILREDRLWLRNQIKNNNTELLNIFKLYPRSTQLQHLQIKLRKFVQNVKSKIKQEQLSKFRETLNAQNLSAFHNRSQIPMSQTKKQNQPKELNNSHSRQHLKSNSSMELSKTTQFRPHRSQEPKQPTQMAMSSSLRHFQELLKYKCNQQVIEERQSQNVTSARLARQENQQQQSRPLQQLAYSSNFNRNKPIQNNFFKEAKENPTLNFRPKANLQATSFSNDKTNSWQFQQMAKRALYQYQPKHQVEERQHQKQYEDQNPGNGSLFNRQSQQAEESIMDKHFVDESQKISPRRQIAQSIKNNGIEMKNSTLCREYTNKFQESFNKQENKWSPKYKSTFQLKQSSFSTLNQNKTKQITENLPDSDRNNQENLFTPLQLLNECRNFLKSRENSITKATVTQPHFQETFKPSEIGQLQSQCLFTRNNYQQNTLPLREQQQQKEEKVQRSEKEEDSGFMYPQIKSPDEKVNYISSSKDQSAACYPHFETFANASNEKVSFEKALNPPQYVRPSLIKEPIQIKPEQPSSIPVNFSIQDLIEDLMQQTEMNPFIQVGHLTQYIATHSESRILSGILSQYSKLGKNEEVCLTAMAEAINLAYNKAHEDSYPHSDSAINAVYDLLDIDQKGYISREDVDSFLNQIQQAEVNNFDQVSEEMLRLFDGADFTNQQRLTYWHLYIVKNSEEFERVSQLLGEFQFEIEREL